MELSYKRTSYAKWMAIFSRYIGKVKSDIDYDRFVEYYKWIDSSLSSMIDHLKPLSARFSRDIVNVVESHMLERNKYEYNSKSKRTQRK